MAWRLVERRPLAAGVDETQQTFLEYLVQIYTGTVEADTLAKLCRQTYANLDTDYRRHLSR